MLQIEYPNIKLPLFPKASLMRSFEPEYIERKKNDLEKYLIEVVKLRSKGLLLEIDGDDIDPFVSFFRGDELNCGFQVMGVNELDNIRMEVY